MAAAPEIEGLGNLPPDAGILGVRPEDFHLGQGAPGDVAVELTVEAVEKVGAETFIYGARPDAQGNQHGNAPGSCKVSRI